MSTDYEDAARLRLLLQHADQSLDETIKNLNQAQMDGAKEKTQYFEKLAIGSGAAIAAIVSFIGTHVGKLHPDWILRCSLIALVVAMMAALYRNLRYPNYVLAVRNRLWVEATRHQQKCKNDVFQIDRSIVSLQTGGQINLQDWTAGFKTDDAALETLIQKRTKEEKRLLKEFRRAEYACLVFISIAMCSLVWLALRNF